LAAFFRPIDIGQSPDNTICCTASGVSIQKRTVTCSVFTRLPPQTLRHFSSSSGPGFFFTANDGLTHTACSNKIPSRFPRPVHPEVADGRPLFGHRSPYAPTCAFRLNRRFDDSTGSFQSNRIPVSIILYPPHSQLATRRRINSRHSALSSESITPG
jgi:hypothetical protein